MSHGLLCLSVEFVYSMLSLKSAYKSESQKLNEIAANLTTYSFVLA